MRARLANRSAEVHADAAVNRMLKQAGVREVVTVAAFMSSI